MVRYGVVERHLSMNRRRHIKYGFKVGSHIEIGGKFVFVGCRFTIVNGWRVCTVCKMQVERIER